MRTAGNRQPCREVFLGGNAGARLEDDDPIGVAIDDGDGGLTLELAKPPSGRELYIAAPAVKQGAPGWTFWRCRAGMLARALDEVRGFVVLPAGHPALRRVRWGTWVVDFLHLDAGGVAYDTAGREFVTNAPRSLEELVAAIEKGTPWPGARIKDGVIDMTRLPTFGGPPPPRSMRAVSWDAERALCPDATAACGWRVRRRLDVAR